MNIRVSYNWIKEYAPTALPPEEFARRLSESGMNVERITPLGAGLEKIVVATVTEVRPHPNADRLRVALVDAGKEIFEVVCGGSNLKAGMKVAFARIGARVRWHGQGEPVELKPAEIRGVKSFGMICAANEIGLADWFPQAEREILDLSWLKAGNGAAIARALDLDDHILEIEVTTNRPDALSVVGLAREAAAILPVKFLWKDPAARTPKIFSGKRKKLPLQVKISDKKLCPRYSAIVFEGIKVEESPWWLRRRLLVSGIRPISNIVDLTNYLMLETGQPLHAFDYDRLAGGVIEVRPAKEGERIKALDGREYTLRAGMMVIADVKKPVAIAGVMGGEESAVSKGTKRVVFESANFDPLSVRQTSRALALSSDSSVRFEKGLSTELPAPALSGLAELTGRLCGGSAASRVVDLRAVKYKPRVFAFSPAAAAELIGSPVKEAEQKRILTSLGFKLSGKGKKYSVIVPWWRDRDIEDSRDFAEEIARIVGYNRLPAVLPPGSPPLGTSDTELAAEDRLKTILSESGAAEIYTYSFVSDQQDKLLGESGPRAVRLTNPLSADSTVMRRSLVPSMLAVIRDAQAWRAEGTLFEISRVYLPATGGGESRLPVESLRVLVACWGPSPAGELFYKIKGYLQKIAEKWNISFALQSLPPPAGSRLPFQFQKSGSGTISPAKPPQSGARRDPALRDNLQPLWHPSRSAEVVFDDRAAGMIGEVHPQVLGQTGIERQTTLLDLSVEAIIAGSRPRVYQSAATYPSVKRDLSFIVGVRKTYDQVISALAGSTPLLTSFSLFDLYQGRGVPPGKKSLAFHLVFGASDRTLSAKDADEALEKIIGQLQGRLGAEIRRA